MDNAVDALKMAFAVFVFVIALSASMHAMGQAREASEHVFYRTDKTNFMEVADESRTKRSSLRGRIVSGETIIPTLYRYYKENFNVAILDESGNVKAKFNLEEEIKDYNNDYRKAPWLGNANIDTKKRIDIEISGKPDKINGVPWTPAVPEGLLQYFKTKKFQEMFYEQRYSGKEVTSSDNESLEIVKGNTKMWIVYKEYNGD